MYSLASQILDTAVCGVATMESTLLKLSTVGLLTKRSELFEVLIGATIQGTRGMFRAMAFQPKFEVGEGYTHCTFVTVEAVMHRMKHLKFMVLSFEYHEGQQCFAGCNLVIPVDWNYVNTRARYVAIYEDLANKGLSRRCDGPIVFPEASDVAAIFDIRMRQLAARHFV